MCSFAEDPSNGIATLNVLLSPALALTPFFVGFRLFSAQKFDKILYLFAILSIIMFGSVFTKFMIAGQFDVVPKLDLFQVIGVGLDNITIPLLIYLSFGVLAYYVSKIDSKYILICAIAALPCVFYIGVINEHAVRVRSDCRRTYEYGEHVYTIISQMILPVMLFCAVTISVFVFRKVKSKINAANQ